MKSFADARVSKGSKIYVETRRRDEGYEARSFARDVLEDPGFPDAFPDQKIWHVNDVITPEGLFVGFVLPYLCRKTPPLSDSSQNHDGAIATETSERCFHDPDRSRVRHSSGSPARDLQNHGNTALTTRWYVSPGQLHIGVHLDASF